MLDSTFQRLSSDDKRVSFVRIRSCLELCLLVSRKTNRVSDKDGRHSGSCYQMERE